MICLHPRLADNPYAKEIDAVLPRLLALGDRDGLSPTCGVLDRQFWAWKLIDFPNATFQGAVNGLSVLLGLDAFAPTIERNRIISRIVQAIEATRRITRRDGSLEEAFPFERSYCVTALVAFDILKALETTAVREAVGDVRADQILAPLIRFLIKSDETHGLISNHLATAAAALLRWEARTGDASAGGKARVLIERILQHGSASEGWYKEYSGADPGYQTLALTHLADIAATGAASERLRATLPAAVRFVADFAHPDGSFGGIYGSRATRIFYPGGVEVLAETVPQAAALAARMRQAIASARTVPLRAIDAANLIPLFNSYCMALARSLKYTEPLTGPSLEEASSSRRVYEVAGLLVDTADDCHTIVSTRKGGVVYHWRGNRMVLCDTGIVVMDKAGRHLTSQTNDPGNQIRLEKDRVIITGALRRISHPLPGPLRFAALRLLAATLMRAPPIGNIVKQGLARYLVSGFRRKKEGSFERTIYLGENFSIEDRWEPAAYRRVAVAPFSSIHMASQGYWQFGDDESTGSETS